MKNIFDQLVKGNIKKHDNFLKIAIGQGDKYIQLFAGIISINSDRQQQV